MMVNLITEMNFMKTTNDLSQLSKFIYDRNGWEQTKPKVKRTIWSVYYLGKEQFKGIYRDCVVFKNQFKQHSDYTKYLIK
jgi:hypothetical protein